MKNLNGKELDLFKITQANIKRKKREQTVMDIDLNYLRVTAIFIREVLDVKDWRIMDKSKWILAQEVGQLYNFMFTEEKKPMKVKQRFLLDHILSAFDLIGVRELGELEQAFYEVHKEKIADCTTFYRSRKKAVSLFTKYLKKIDNSFIALVYESAGKNIDFDSIARKALIERTK